MTQSPGKAGPRRIGRASVWWYPMKASFVLLALADLALLATTAAMGLMVSGTQGFLRHFLLGILSGMFTCFVHIVLYMYFVVQDKIMKQSAMTDGLSSEFVRQTEGIKLHAFRASMTGIFAILVAVTLGASVGILTPAGAHLVAAFAAIAVNSGAFFYQYALLDRYSVVFRRAFPEG